jgi:hypothetical protein
MPSIVVDRSGNWRVMKNEDAEVYSQNGYSYYQFSNLLLIYSRVGFKIGLLVYLVRFIQNHTIDSPVIAMICMTFVVLNLINQVRW